MGTKWSTARHFHAVLGVLVSDLRVKLGPKSGSRGLSSTSPSSGPPHVRHDTPSALGSNPIADPLDLTPAKRQKTGNWPELRRSQGGHSGTQTPNRQGQRNSHQTAYQYVSPHHGSQTHDPSLQQAFAVTAFDEASVSAQNSNPSQRQRQDESRQWLREPISSGLYPDMGDLFGQVSLEALFQEGINGEGPGQWDSALNEFA